MSDKPVVSIITPLYDAGVYIAETIESVIHQEFTDWEYLIVDDCSTDNGPAIAEKYAATDSRIRVIQLQENAGAGVSRNAGIEASRGRFIAFLDSDDKWLPSKLSRHLDFMKTNDVPFSFTDYILTAEDGTDLGHIVRCRKTLSYRRQLKTNYVGCSTVVIDTDFYGKRYFPEIRKRQDFGLWLELLKSGPPALGFSEALTVYRVRKTGLSGRKVELVKHNWLLYREVLAFGPIRSAYYLCWNIAIKILGGR